MAPRVSNGTIATFLSRLATLMEIAGENAFRVRAIRNGADAVRNLTEPIEPLANDPAAMRSIPGIGSGISALITEIVATGTTGSFQELQNKAPEGLIEIVGIPGIGAKTALKLYELAGVRDIDSLQKALDTNLIATTPGLGAKLAEKLAAGLEALARKTGRTRLGVSLPIARDLLSSLRAQLKPDQRIELTGSLRRWEETTGDIDLLTTLRPELIAELVGFHFQLSGIVLNSDSVQALHDSGINLEIISTTAEEFGRRWIETTGPFEHVALLGSFNANDLSSEESIYASKGLPLIAPEFRQGLDELERAANGELEDVITIADIRGELHCHSVWSDGKATVEEMAYAARARGYDYLGISDHSHSLGVANGLNQERLLAQAEEIAEISGRLGMPLLRSSEVEVHRDGSLDFDEATLHGLDVVIASTHSGLTRPREELMNRLDNALSGSRVDILAHPSGRLIETREPGDFDWPALFALAKARGVALEINADPARLDLNADHARQAIEAGCLITINCDAHSTRGFENLEYGIAVARRGFVPRDRVINTWDINRLRAWLASPEDRAADQEATGASSK